MSTSVILLNTVILFVVLESDLGRRKIGLFRVTRPIVTAAAVVPLFIVAPATAGNGAALELGLTALGVLLGLYASTRLMRVGVDERRGVVTSQAGFGYAAFWAVVVAARLLFAYGATHWYANALGHWMASNNVSGDALTDGLVFMAVAMTVTRSLRLAIRRTQLRAAAGRTLAVQA